jgi:hypothetical protein
MRKSSHISLSNTACFENPRSKGGKRNYVITQLNAWLKERAPETKTVKHPISGELIEFVEGKLRICTVRPNFLAELPERKLGTYDFKSDAILGWESGRRGF